MHSNNCLSQALSYYQSPQGAYSARGGPTDGNAAAQVVAPKAKVGVMLELDLGSGYVRLTESGDHQRQHVHGLSFSEMAELFAGCFGPSHRPKAQATDYARQWHDLRAALRKFICEEPAATGTTAPTTGTTPPASTTIEADECRKKLAQLQAKVTDAYRKLITDAGRDHQQVLKLAEELENACK